MSEIYTALASVMDDCKGVAKRDRNDHQRFMFRGIDAVVNAVGPILRKHGVIVVPNVEHVSYDTVQTSTGKPATACRVLVTYTFYASDGSSIDSRVAAESWDAGDKAAPKAMSVAFRTALLQALALPTDEPDPDSQVYVRDNHVASHATATLPPSYPPTDPGGHPIDADASAMKKTTRGRMFALFGDLGITDEAEQKAGMSKLLGREVASRGSLTEGEARVVIKALEARKNSRQEQPA